MKRIIERGSNVVPVDTAGRVIKLAVHLTSIWKQDASVSDAEISFIFMHAPSEQRSNAERSMAESVSKECITALGASK